MERVHWEEIVQATAGTINDSTREALDFTYLNSDMSYEMYTELVESLENGEWN
jgi:hypothetical protein